MDEYLIILEKELKVFTDRIRDESMDKISKIMTDLESAHQQQTKFGEEIDNLRKENERLEGENTELREEIDDLKIQTQAFEENEKDLREQLEDKSKHQEQSPEVDQSQIDDFKQQIEDLETRNRELLEEIDSLQEEKIEFTEQLKFTEKELQDAQERISQLKKTPVTSKVVESSRESDDGREYLDRIDAIEKKYDLIKEEIGEIKVKSFDELKQMYNQKHKEEMENIQGQLLESNLSKKGKLNVLRELIGTMNESIRVLK